MVRQDIILDVRGFVFEFATEDEDMTLADRDSGGGHDASRDIRATAPWICEASIDAGFRVVFFMIIAGGGELIDICEKLDLASFIFSSAAHNIDTIIGAVVLRCYNRECSRRARPGEDLLPCEFFVMYI
jgi:hypothetical protein